MCRAGIREMHFSPTLISGLMLPVAFIGSSRNSGKRNTDWFLHLNAVGVPFLSPGFAERTLG
jgi:hypothetical protein